MKTINFKIKLIKIAFVSVMLGLLSCSDTEQLADAYGNFEAEETLISSEANGKLLMLNIIEGQKLQANQKVGMVDTIIPSLQLVEIQAQQAKIQAGIANIEAQKQVIVQQKENLEIELKRVENMRESGASTQKQWDDISGQIKVVNEQLKAYDAQKTATAKELKILNAKKILLKEQLSKCQINNPKPGMVIEKYAEQGEITAAGKPLYKIADLDNIILKAYVSGGQLHAVKIGKKCKVRIDKGQNEYLDYEGTITWVSSQAEFTPKIIQTKDERVNMVYAIKVLVKNNGAIKLGMPGEVILL